MPKPLCELKTRNLGRSLKFQRTNTEGLGKFCAEWTIAGAEHAGVAAEMDGCLWETVNISSRFAPTRD